VAVNSVTGWGGDGQWGPGRSRRMRRGAPYPAYAGRIHPLGGE